MPQCGRKLLLAGTSSEAVLVPGATALSSPAPALTLNILSKMISLELKSIHVPAEPERGGMKTEFVPPVVLLYAHVPHGDQT